MFNHSCIILDHTPWCMYSPVVQFVYRVALQMIYPNFVMVTPLALKDENNVWTLQWRHNERDGFSNHRVSIVCSTICSTTDKKSLQSSASPWPLRGEFADEFPAQRASNAENDDVIMKTIVSANNTFLAAKLPLVLQPYSPTNPPRRTQSICPCSSRTFCPNHCH